MSTDHPADPSDTPWPRAGQEGPAWRSAPAGVDTLPPDALPGAEPQDFAQYDGLPPNQAWVAGGAGSGESRYGMVRLAVLLAAVVAGVYFFGPYVFIIIGGLLVSITLHEFGHYWTAKRSGMKVTEFFLGFGPRLWSFQRGETEYGLKLIPAGAYVRIIGMNNLEEVDPADEPRTYREQSAPKRMATVLAGPAMNILIALTLLVVVFMAKGPVGENWSSTRTDWTVESVQAGSAAALAGLQEGDRVISVGGEPVTTFDAFRAQIDTDAGRQMPVVVERDGQQLTLQPTFGWRLNKAAAGAIPSSPPLLASDIVATVDGRPVATYDELAALLGQTGDPVTLVIERGGSNYSLVVPRPVTLPTAGASGYLGVRASVPSTPESFVGALGETGRLFATMATGTFAGFGKLFSPEGASNYVSQFSGPTTTVAGTPAQPNVLTPIGEAPGPSAATAAESARPVSIVGIVQVGSGAAEQGIWQFLMLLAVVNFALALINLLPVLPFDGGHAVIAGYEGIRGSIRHERYQADLTKMMPIVYGVFALLLVLGLSSIVLDLMHPVNYGP